MINKNELLLVVDSNNVPKEPKPRHEVHSNGYWHRTAHIWIINTHKEILCQKRSLLKDMNPGKWEPFFGGHMAPGEEYITNAKNELKEELGLQSFEENIHQFTIFKNLRGREFQGVHYLVWNGDIAELILEKDEVDQVKWIPLEVLYETIITEKDDNWSQMGYEKELLKYFKALA